MPRQAEVFPDREHFGKIFFNQANMSNLGISQVTLNSTKNSDKRTYTRLPWSWVPAQQVELMYPQWQTKALLFGSRAPYF